MKLLCGGGSQGYPGKKKVDLNFNPSQIVMRDFDRVYLKDRNTPSAGVVVLLLTNLIVLK